MEKRAFWLCRSSAGLLLWIATTTYAGPTEPGSPSDLEGLRTSEQPTDTSTPRPATTSSIESTTASLPGSTTASSSGSTTTSSLESTTALTSPSGAPSTDAREPLTLEAALARVLLHSPELDAWAWEVRAREAAELHSGVRPNPELGLGVENLGGGGESSQGGVLGTSETTLVLSQVFELGGKRGKRKALAEEDLGLATLDYELARSALFAETKKAFYAVLAAQEQLALSQELTSVAEEVLASVTRRVSAGSSSPVEANRARVELESTRIDRDRAERMLGGARIRLAALWGDTRTSFQTAIGDIRERGPVPSRETLHSRVESGPAAGRWDAVLDHRSAALDLERAAAAPDLSLGSGLRYSRDPGDVSFLIELSVPLPLFDRNLSASGAASMQVERARSDARAARLRLEAEAVSFQEELLATESEIESLETRVLPEAEAAFRSSQDAYLRGGMRLNDVLDSERALYELKSRQIDALARFHIALADLEHLLGTPIEVPGSPQP